MPTNFYYSVSASNHVPKSGFNHPWCQLCQKVLSYRLQALRDLQGVPHSSSLHLRPAEAFSVSAIDAVQDVRSVNPPTCKGTSSGWRELPCFELELGNLDVQKPLEYFLMHNEFYTLIIRCIVLKVHLINCLSEMDLKLYKTIQKCNNLNGKSSQLNVANYFEKMLHVLQLHIMHSVLLIETWVSQQILLVIKVSGERHNQISEWHNYSILK